MRTSSCYQSINMCLNRALITDCLPYSTCRWPKLNNKDAKHVKYQSPRPKVCITLLTRICSQYVSYFLGDIPAWRQDLLKQNPRVVFFVQMWQIVDVRNYELGIITMFLQTQFKDLEGDLGRKLKDRRSEDAELAAKAMQLGQKWKSNRPPMQIQTCLSLLQ